MERIKNLLETYREIIMYLIMGVLTTAISLLVYYICTMTFLDPANGLHLQIANVISWTVAIAFAFFSNKKFVFEKSNKGVFEELFLFVSSRVATLLIDMSLMFVFVTMLNYNDKIIKLIVQIVVIVLNYVLSKLIVFKNKNKNNINKGHIYYIVGAIMSILFVILEANFSHLYITNFLAYATGTIIYILTVFTIFIIGKSLLKKK